jgi:hypothetical protein
MIKAIKATNHGWIENICSLIPMINILHGLSANTNLQKFTKVVSKRLKHRGEADTIKFLKGARLVAQQYCLKQMVTPIPFCKSDKDG